MSSYTNVYLEVLKQYELEREDRKYLVNDSTMGVANYLISLYFRTGLKYRYYRQKINRLLTIYKLCSLKYNTNALRYDFIIANNGRMGCLNGMYSPFDNKYEAIMEEDGSEITDYIEYYYFDKYYLSWGFIEISRDFGEDIDKEMRISQESRDLLELIFRKFGNYSTQELGHIIDEVVIKLPFQELKEEPYYFEEYKWFKKFVADNEEYLKENIVFNFIKNFDRLNISNSYNMFEENDEQKSKQNPSLRKKLEK